MSDSHNPPRPLTAKEKKVLEFIESYIGDRGIAPSYQEIKEFFGFASFNSVQRYLKQLQKKQYIYIPPGNQKRAITVLQSSQTIQNLMSQEAPTSGGMGINNHNPSTTQNPFLPNLLNKGPSPEVQESRQSTNSLTQEPSTQGSHLFEHQVKGPEEEASPNSPPVAESLFLPLLGRVAAGHPIEALDHDEFVPAPPNLVRNASKTFALKVEGESMIEDGILDGDIIFVQEQNTANNGETVVATVDGEATVKRFYFHKPSPFSQHKETLKHPMIELRPANSNMQPMWFEPEDVHIRGVVVGLIRTM